MEPLFHLTLDFNVRSSLLLKMPFLSSFGILAPHRSLDVDGVSIVPFYEVGVVAVDSLQEVHHCGDGVRVQRSANSVGSCQDLGSFRFKVS